MSTLVYLFEEIAVTFFLTIPLILSLSARLAQSVEHQTFNLRVKGSSPLLGACFFLPL